MPDDPVESLLRRYRPAGPDSALRIRVVREPRRTFNWAFLESMAALLLVGVTLSQIAASVTHIFPTPPAASAAHVQQITAALSALDLPLTPDQTQSMAQRLAAGEQLSLLPDIHSNLNPFGGAR